MLPVYPTNLPVLQVAALRRSLGAEGALKRGCHLPLWRPPLEVPFPLLQPAVFPPAFVEPPPPALELFDLDEEFAGPLVSRVGLARGIACQGTEGQLCRLPGS